MGGGGNGGNYKRRGGGLGHNNNRYRERDRDREEGSMRERNMGRRSSGMIRDRNVSGDEHRDEHFRRRGNSVEGESSVSQLNENSRNVHNDMNRRNQNSSPRNVAESKSFVSHGDGVKGGCGEGWNPDRKENEQSERDKQQSNLSVVNDGNELERETTASYREENRRETALTQQVADNDDPEQTPAVREEQDRQTVSSPSRFTNEFCPQANDSACVANRQDADARTPQLLEASDGEEHREREENSDEKKINEERQSISKETEAD